MKLRMQRPFTATPGRQRGAVLVLVVIALAAMLLMGALALDGGHMLLNKTRLQNAVDAAALSGAKTLFQVKDSGNAYTLTRDDALNTLRLNADADGNTELAAAIDKVGGVGNFAVVELSSSVYGTFSADPTDARFVRVWVRNYGLAGFFWNFAQSFGNGSLGAKAVAAIATAGWSPTQPCKVEPLLICGDPDPLEYKPKDGLFWGYRVGEVTVLKSAANSDSSIGPGNFQLLDFDNGGKAVEEALADGSECNVVGDPATTEPGNKVGPVAHGLNTRFEGDTADHVTDYTHQGNDAIWLDGDTVKYGSDPVTVNYSSDPIQAYKSELTAGATSLFDYKDWIDKYASEKCPGVNCGMEGAPYRRILNIVIGDCTGKEAGEFNGKSDIPVLGFACYFTLQPVKQGGGEAQIFGQFVDECNGDSAPSATPWDDSGPNTIQLYKTYFNGGIADPSRDS